MDKMIVVQVYDDRGLQSAVQLVDSFIQYGFKCNLHVYAAESAASSLQLGDVPVHVVPSACDNMSKAKNFILNETKGMSRFLHIVESGLALLKDPAEFINQVQDVMDALDYSIYFSTITDRCNYMFNKFCPRLTVAMDDETIARDLKLPCKLSFTSHSNTMWTIYDRKQQEDTQKYDENFSIAMYMIIEYLARRRATKKNGQLFYMNQYLSVPAEVGVFKMVGDASENVDTKKIQEEDALFKQMKVDYYPDNSIDRVLEDLYNAVKRKASKYVVSNDNEVNT